MKTFSSMQVSALNEAHQQVKMHRAIAEQGKVHALEGDHDLACRYYRHAMQMVELAEESRSYLKTYLQWLLESLEHSGRYEDVINYCNQMLGYYLNHANNPQFAEKAALLCQMKGVNLLKLGRSREGIACLEEGHAMAEKAGTVLPLVQNLLFLVGSGLKLDRNRILAEQKRNYYFEVTELNTQEAMAMRLPEQELTR